ncbi:MAG: hypothetical protein GC145_09715 [Caulobacter sp.]|nr:hypothetical protein [Caulobacter sp.]
MSWTKALHAALAFSLAIVAPLCAQAAEPQPLPAFSLRLTCDPTDRDKTRAEVDGIQDLMAFAEQNDGRPVYLDAVITADAGAGGCLRDYSGTDKRPSPSADGPVIWIDRCSDAKRCWRKGQVQVTALGPPLAVSTSIVLPRPEDIPEFLPYRMGGYGDWLNYQGPFIVRFYDATGFIHAAFTVPDPALTDVWRNAACNARPDACP